MDIIDSLNFRADKMRNSRTDLLADDSDPVQWQHVRAMATSPGSAAPGMFHLGEDSTPGNTHDTRTSVALPADAGSAFSFGIFARPAERVCMAIWLGGGADRAEAVFDLAEGVVARSGNAGRGWTLTAAGIVPLNDGWAWCHLGATATDAASIEVHLFLMRDAATQYYDGDGRSGLWLARPQLEAVARMAVPRFMQTSAQPGNFAGNLRHVDDLGAVLLGFLAGRHKAMGSHGGGLGIYYSFRLQQGRPFIHHDVGIANWILVNRPEVDVVVDVGAGLGQVPFLLAANGQKCIAIESNAPRFKALEALHAEVGRWRPEIASRVEPQGVTLPRAIEQIRDKSSLAFFAFFVKAMSAIVEREIVRSLRQFSEIILDLRCFGRMIRDTQEQRDELLAILREEGFSEPEAIRNWDVGQYAIIRPLPQ